MTSNQLKELLNRYVDEVWTKRNIAALDRFLAATYRRHLGRDVDPLTRDGQQKLLVEFHAAFPDAELTLEEVVVERDLIAFRSRMRGTHLGVFRGFPATGKKVEASLLDMIRVQNGKFVEQWGGPDLLDLLQQLGAFVTAPARSREQRKPKPHAPGPKPRR
jgi:predicted ester cyclase